MWLGKRKKWNLERVETEACLGYLPEQWYGGDSNQLKEEEPNFIYLYFIRV